MEAIAIAKKRRSGFSLVELLIAVVVLGILSAMVLAAGTASQNKARTTVAVNDLDSIKNAIYQALMTDASIMKYRDDKPTTSIDNVVTFINQNLDDTWQMTRLTANQGSGGVAFTEIQRDPWGAPYGLYVYTNTNRKTYHTDSTRDAASGNVTSATAATANDSIVYIVIASSGRNGTGGPLGVDGTNYESGTGAIIDPTKMVNNSDGIDDVGIIIRIKNGTLMTGAFGSDSAGLGTLKNTQWIYGIPSANGGVLHDFTGDATTNKSGLTITNADTAESGSWMGGSLDVFYDAQSITNAMGAGGKLVIGDWEGTGKYCSSTT